MGMAMYDLTKGWRPGLPPTEPDEPSPVAGIGQEVAHGAPARGRQGPVAAQAFPVEDMPDRDASLPSRGRDRADRRSKYPFRQLEVGQRFVVPAGEGQPKLSTMQVLCSNKTRAMSGKFRCRRLENGAIEVWRER